MSGGTCADEAHTLVTDEAGWQLSYNVCVMTSSADPDEMAAVIDD